MLKVSRDKFYFLKLCLICDLSWKLTYFFQMRASVTDISTATLNCPRWFIRAKLCTPNCPRQIVSLQIFLDFFYVFLLFFFFNVSRFYSSKCSKSLFKIRIHFATKQRPFIHKNYFNHINFCIYFPHFSSLLLLVPRNAYPY